MTKEYWICAIITLISALVSFGFSAAPLFSKDKSTRDNGLYSFSRSTAIAIACAVLLFHHSHDWLVATALIATTVQAIDVVIGALKRLPGQTFGPAALAALNLSALIWYVT